MKKKDVQPSPATTPQTPVSARPASASRKSGEQPIMPEQNAPPSPAAPAPDAPTPSKPLTISDDTHKEAGDGGKSGEAEAESHLRALDLEALHPATRRELSISNA